MNKKIIKFVNQNIGNFSITSLQNEASSRKYYRVSDNKKTYIVADSSREKKKFKNYINVYNIIKNTHISIPQIIKLDNNNHLMILEDFGDNRFDKIIHNNKYTDHLLKIAIESLAILKNSVFFEKDLNLQIYNFKSFKKEISEFIDWYYPFVWKKNISLINKNYFYSIWENAYKNINFNSHSFVHKDFFCNNLIYLSSRKDNLKCGIIDFQDAYWGDEVLDIVSLFEDSRRIIKNESREYLINFFLKETKQIKYKNEFLIKYNFIGAARQTRLLGRWIKLMQKNHKLEYLKYINTTWYWLEKNLEQIYLSDLKKFYQALIPNSKRTHEN